MNRFDKMARDVFGVEYPNEALEPDHWPEMRSRIALALAKVDAAAREEEREACAQRVEQFYKRPIGQMRRNALEIAVAAIRARKDSHE